MAVDVAPELLEQIQIIFDNKLKGNKKITAIYNKIQNGAKLTYEDANTFSQEVGDALASAFKRVFTPESLPDGRMYYNIADRVVRPMLKGNYDLIADVAEQTQWSLNRAAGINLGVKRPEINADRVQGLVDKVSSYDDYAQAAWVLQEPVVNFSQSVVDGFINENADFQYKAGMQPKIIRKISGNCCEWCAVLAGEYDYPNVPEDVYRRHKYCRCSVMYQPVKGKYQDVHSKRKYVDAHQSEIEERKSVLREKAEPKTTFKTAKTIEEAENIARSVVDMGRFGAMGVSYKGISVDVANIVNKTILDVFDTFKLEKFGGITAPAGNTKVGQKIKNATAAYSPIRNGFYLNRNSLKTVKSAEKALLDSRKVGDDLLTNPQKYDFSKLSPTLRKIYDNSKRSGRFTYPTNIESVLHHELGHALEKGVYNNPLWGTAQKNISAYAGNISGYASIDNSEYIAESFAAYMSKDYGILDPLMISIFDELKR